MGTAVLRPDGTIQAPVDVWTVVDTTAHGATSDDSDATWVENDGDPDVDSSAKALDLEIEDGSSTLPAGAKVKAVRVRVRNEPENTVDDDHHFAHELHVGGFGADNRHRWVGGPLVLGLDGIGWRAGPWWAERPGGGQWSLDDLDVFSLRSGSKNLHYALYEATVEVDYAERPDVEITGPVSPESDTSRPTVTWDYTVPSDGSPQEAFEMLVFDSSAEPAGGWPGSPDSLDADPVYDPGTVVSDQHQHQIAVDLSDGETYQIYVRARREWDGGDFWSLWDGWSLSMSLTAADAPTLTLAPDPSQARTLVSVEADMGTAPAGTDEAWLRVEYRDDGDWVDLRFAARIDVATSGTVSESVYDHEAPFNVERAYRARVYVDVGGNVVASPEDTGEATVVTAVRWLTDVLDPDRLHVEVAGRGHERTFAGREVVHRPAGLSTAVVEAEPPVRADSLTFVTTSRTAASHDDLEVAMGSTRTLLYRDRRESVFLRLTGSRQRRQVSWDGAKVDEWSASAVEVARPEVS